MGVGIPRWIFRCVFFGGGGGRSFLMRSFDTHMKSLDGKPSWTVLEPQADRRLALRPNSTCEGTSVVGSGENIISWLALKEASCCV